MIGGAIFSPPDERDYTIASAMEMCAVDIPVEFEVWQPPVEDQEQTGNCVSQAAANICECQEHKLTGIHTNYSVGFPYGDRLSTDTMNPGLIPRQLAANLIKDGNVYRYEFESFSEMPEIYQQVLSAKPGLMEKLKRLFQSYVRLYTKEEVQLFILKYKLPVLVTVDASVLSWMASGGHGISGYGWCNPASWPHSSTKEAGYSFYADGADIKITNSWGIKWGINGQGGVNFNDIKEIWGFVPVDKTFLDVQDDRWSASVIKEAALDGVLLGYPDGTFKPEASITREEYAAARSRDKINNCKITKNMIEEKIAELKVLLGVQ